MIKFHSSLGKQRNKKEASKASLGGQKARKNWIQCLPGLC